MSLQKHLLNSPETLVSDSLRGLCAVNQQLSYDASSKVVYRPDSSKQVQLICGGGSGHEPAHAGFVGEGILSAAVCGSVFASPNAGQVRRAIDLIDHDESPGILIIVKNYTGDVLNFGLAREQYIAEHGGKDKGDRAKFLVVGDDVAVGRTQGSIVGRRGLAGVVLVYKIAGALAAQGASLTEVYEVAEWASNNIGTIGVGLEHCHVPGTATGETYLAADEIEIGLGIHNESGIRRLSPVPPLKELVPQLLDLIMATDDKDRSFLPFVNDGSDEVVLFVNNLGGLSELELGGIVAAVYEELKTRKVNVLRVISGTFMTSLNMPGFSISLLLLPRTTDSSIKTSEILSLLDAPAKPPGWKWTAPSAPNNPIPGPRSAESAPGKASKNFVLTAQSPESFVAAIQRACESIIAAEPEITRMDTIAGDGDCGLTLKAGAAGVKEGIEHGRITGKDLIDDIVSIAKVGEQSMGGTSGALYSIFFSALAQGLESNASQTTKGTEVATTEIWNAALDAALKRLYTYTRARPPSRTLVDPLSAFVENLFEGYPAAVKSAADAAEETKNVEAKAGRSAYVDSGLLTKERVADPGAWGVKVILEALFR